jgi:hypothetical protein
MEHRAEYLGGTFQGAPVRFPPSSPDFTVNVTTSTETCTETRSCQSYFTLSC